MILFLSVPVKCNFAAKKVNAMYHMSYIIISTNLNFSGTGRRALSTLLSVGVSFSKLEIFCFRLYAANPELLTAIYYSFASKPSLIQQYQASFSRAD